MPNYSAIVGYISVGHFEMVFIITTYIKCHHKITIDRRPPEKNDQTAFFGILSKLRVSFKVGKSEQKSMIMLRLKWLTFVKGKGFYQYNFV